MYLLRRIFVQPPLRYVLAVLLALIVGIFRFLTLPEGIGARFMWFEIFSVSGYVTVLIGALLTVSYFGAFDIFGFAFSPGQLGGQKKYKDFVHYTEAKTEKRTRGGYDFVPFYVVGIIELIVCAFLR